MAAIFVPSCEGAMKGLSLACVRDPNNIKAMAAGAEFMATIAGARTDEGQRAVDATFCLDLLVNVSLRLAMMSRIIETGDQQSARLCSDLVIGAYYDVEMRNHLFSASVFLGLSDIIRIDFPKIDEVSSALG